MRLSARKGEMIVSLYIPEVNLPSEGDFELWIAVKKDGTFTYNIDGAWHNGQEKALQVKKHGDLIDGEALILRCKDKKGSYYGHDSAVIGEAVESAPVVIGRDV